MNRTRETRPPELEARIRRTGTLLALLSSALFAASMGLILLRWWTR